ncbi:MAG: PEP-CTERM sorting domain-containing protein, partial [Phycisphaerae bacterium]
SRKVTTGEMRMRRAASLLAVGVAMFVGAETAKADMLLTGTKVAGTGALAGYDIWQLSATNNGANATGNDIQAWDLILNWDNSNAEPTAGFQPFWFWKTNASNVSPNGAAIFGAADFAGETYIDAINKTGFTAGDTFGNATNKGQGTFLGLIGDGPSGSSYNPNMGSAYKGGTQTPSGTLNSVYSTTKTMRSAASYAFQEAGFPNDRLTGTVRAGNVIVQAGRNFSVTGSFLPNAGGNTSLPQYQVNFTTAVPEPASLGLIGVAMMALGRRRRA